MPLQYANLDPATRRFSLAELERDAANKTLIIPDRLRSGQFSAYQKLLTEALKYYDDLWLEEHVQSMLVDVEPRRMPSLGQTIAQVPENAARILAEGDFNRYYMRGVCARALAEGRAEVEVYRARLSVEPRPESTELEGAHLSAAYLLGELRGLTPKTLPIATLGRPGSGMSVRLIQQPA